MKFVKSRVLIILVILSLGLICIGVYNINKTIVKKHQQFIYCKLIQQGMSQEEVRKVLKTVGNFKETDYTIYLDNLVRTRIDFSDTLLSHLSGGPTIFGYNNDKLVVRYILTSLSDHYIICDEDRPK